MAASAMLGRMRSWFVGLLVLCACNASLVPPVYSLVEKKKAQQVDAEEANKATSEESKEAQQIRFELDTAPDPAAYFRDGGAPGAESP